MSTTGARPQTAFHLGNGGAPLADISRRFRWIVTIKEGIAALFRHDPDVLVAGDLPWYPVEGNPRVRIAPNVFVAFGRPKGERNAYRQSEEAGIAPQVVFEVQSPGSRPIGWIRRFEFYQRHGVEEYYLYAPDHGVLDGWLRTGRRLKEIRRIAGFVSPRLQVRFEPGEGPDRLTVIGPDGDPFLTYGQLVDQFKAERQRADRYLAKLRELGIEPD